MSKTKEGYIISFHDEKSAQSYEIFISIEGKLGEIIVQRSTSSMLNGKIDEVSVKKLEEKVKLSS